jgi:hypothetical protein
MNRHLITLLAILILAGAFTVSANAQTTGTQKVVANIPFAFNVGNKDLPAGKYTITVVNPSSDRKILQIRNANGRASVIISTNAVAGKVSDDARLTFKRYGDRYFFSQAQLAGDSTGFAALKSHAERAQKMLAAAGKQSVIVVIAE